MKKKVKNIGDMKINFIGTLEIPKKDKKKTKSLGDMLVPLFGIRGMKKEDIKAELSKISTEKEK